MKILITGASGFIGSYLFKYFTENKHDVYGLIRKKTNIKYLNSKKNKLINCDLADYESLNKFLPKKLDMIIHAGASNDQDTNNNVKNAYLTNIYGTRNVCRIAKSRNVKFFFYFSVLQVYGRELNKKIRENSVVTCDNDYSLSHYLAENVCENYSKISKIKFLIMRLGYMFGCPIDGNIDRKTLIPYVFCDQAIKQKKISLLSQGNSRRDFMSIDKLSENIENLIKKKSKKFEIFNFVSGFSYSMRDIAKIVQFEAKKILKQEIPISYKVNSNDKKNIFKVYSKLKIYKNKKYLNLELKKQIKKTLLSINEN